MGRSGGSHEPPGPTGRLIDRLADRAGRSTRYEERPTVFTGEYRHTVDEKGRLAVPSKFRSQLETGAVVSRWMDECLAIHTRRGWDDLAAKVAQLPISDTGARLFQRYVFAGAFEADLDRQGRVVIPAYLREFAGLTGDAVVVGSRDHAEIWAPDRWADYSKGLADPARLAEALEGLGI